MMDRPRIKPGVDSRVLAVLLAAAMFAGCLAQPLAKRPHNPDTNAVTLSDFAYQSFRKRDRLRAVKLRAIAEDVKAGRLKYDGPVMEAIEQAGAEASRESWQPVADQLAKLLNDRGKKLDAAKCEQALRELADGAERAGK
jgi:hypothetical protein